MAIQNSDKLIVGRGDESYQVYLSDSGLAKEDDVVSKSGDTMSGNLNFIAGVDINFIGNNTGINLESPYWGGLKYDGQLVFEWKADAIQAGRDLNMKLGNVDFLSPEAESQYAGSDQHGGHSIQWLKAPSHKYDATNKEYVDKGFVKKVGGDSMQGPLTIEAVNSDGRASNKINTLGIYSNSSNSALRLGTTRDRLYVGHDDVSINGPLKVGEIQEKDTGKGVTVSSHFKVGEIRMEPGGYIGSAANPRLIFNNAGSGNEGDGLLVVPRPSVPRRGFVIRGNDADGNEQDMLYTYTNYSGTPDAINYRGKMDSGYNLVNKEYVDDVIGTTMPKNINTLPLLST